jgi:hypothetical protein
MNLTASSKLALALMLIVPAFSLHAAEMSIKCDKKSLADTLAKLDKNQPNTVNITEDCKEDIVISGHKDLTIIGHDGASISATVFDPGDFLLSTNPLSVENSNLTLQDLTINGGRDAVACYTRSVCTLQDVTITGGHGGVSAQGETAMFILGSSSITGIQGTGIGIYGASRVDMGPGLWAGGWDPTDAGPVVSNNRTGVLVQDGSFFRSDNVTISNNSIVGIWARRNATVKVFSQPAAGLPGVSFNGYEGVALESGSALQIGAPVTDNGTDGIYIGTLSSATQAFGTTFSGNGGLDVSCNHSTSVDVNFGICP